MSTHKTEDLGQAVETMRTKALDLLEEMSRHGFAADAELCQAVADMQTVVNRLGASAASLADPPPVSQDAAIVLALASTAIPFASGEQDEAERWLRVMRLHGQVGAALQALGVPEGPLETPAEKPTAQRRMHREEGADPVAQVHVKARDLARQRGAANTGTLEVCLSPAATYVDRRALPLQLASETNALRPPRAFNSCGTHIDASSNYRSRVRGRRACQGRLRMLANAY